MATAATIQPTLEHGERLSLAEFLWRWEQMPELKNAELIEGIVYLASPVSRIHWVFDRLFHAWLHRYLEVVEGFEIAPNPTCLLEGNAFQPDIALCRLRPGEEYNYIETAPELIVEISNSTRSLDLGPKLAGYRTAGVKEYIAVLVKSKRVEWRVLAGSAYRLLQPDAAGLIHSPSFPGLILDIGAVFPPDIKRMMAAIKPA